MWWPASCLGPIERLPVPRTQGLGVLMGLEVRMGRRSYSWEFKLEAVKLVCKVGCRLRRRRSMRLTS